MMGAILFYFVSGKKSRGEADGVNSCMSLKTSFFLDAKRTESGPSFPSQQGWLRPKKGKMIENERRGIFAMKIYPPPPSKKKNTPLNEGNFDLPKKKLLVAAFNTPELGRIPLFLLGRMGDFPPLILNSMTNWVNLLFGIR